MPLDRSRRDSPDWFARFDALRTYYAAFSPHDGSRCDASLIRYSDLSAQYSKVAYRDAAGQSGLRRNHHAVTDIAVMSDMHEVVELRSGAHSRYAQRRAIHTRVSADLHIVPNLYRADLRKFHVAVAL